MRPSKGYRRRRATPCVFMHRSRRLYLTVHGDDFFAGGGAADVKWLEENPLKAVEFKVKGRFVEPGDELRVLKCVVHRTEMGGGGGGGGTRRTSATPSSWWPALAWSLTCAH